jgi:hypothetical protein
MRKTTKAHGYHMYSKTLIRKEKLALQKQQLPWRRLYRGGKPPEDGFMKPKHVV